MFIPFFPISHFSDISSKLYKTFLVNRFYSTKWKFRVFPSFSSLECCLCSNQCCNLHAPLRLLSFNGINEPTVLQAPSDNKAAFPASTINVLIFVILSRLQNLFNLWSCSKKITVQFYLQCTCNCFTFASG